MYADDCLIYSIGNRWEDMIPDIQAGLDGLVQEKLSKVKYS